MNKRVFTIILIVFVLLICLASCSSDPISSPNLKYDKETRQLQWEEVDGAIGYKIYMYTTDLSSEVYEGYPITVTECYITLTREGTYSITVMALAKNEKRNSSAIAISVVVSSDNTDIDDIGELPSDEEIAVVYDNQYYLKGSNEDYLIEVDEGFEIEQVYSTVFQSNYWEIDANTLKIKSGYLNQFGSGARVEVVYEVSDANGELSIAKSQIYIVNKMPNTIKNTPDIGYFTYNMSDPRYISIKLTNQYESTTSDIVKVVLNNTVLSKYNDFTVDVTPAEQIINFSSKLLKNLVPGMVDVSIVTSNGTLYSKIFVYSQDYTPYDIIVDPDSSYPNIYLKWNTPIKSVDDYVVEINNVKYSKINYPNLFEGNSFNLTDVYVSGAKVTIASVVDGQEYKSQEIPLINYEKFKDYLSYDEGFYYLGTNYNRYIFTQKEFDTLGHYLLMNFSEIAYDYQGEKRASIDIAFNSQEFLVITDSQGNSSNMVSEIPSMLGSAFKNFAEGFFFNENYTQAQLYLVDDLGYGAFRITIRQLLSTSIPNEKCNSATLGTYREEDSQLLQAVSARVDEFDDFAINSRKKTAEVTTSEELYMTVELGFKPLPKAGSSAEIIYNQAKQVLRQIVNDNMTDYMKFVSIYEWIAMNVVYDYDSANKSSQIKGNAYAELYAYRCFYLEGVFIDKIAVCNGMAKAVSLMCNIEGIACHKITGFVNRAAHAWNKVLIDGIWYVSDITWGNVLNKTESIEYISHEYMLMSEEKSLEKRKEEVNRGLVDYVHATENFDYYTTTTYYYNDKLIDRYITSDEELIELCDYVASNSVSKGNTITFDIKCASGYTPPTGLATDNALIVNSFKGDNNIHYMRIERR